MAKRQGTSRQIVRPVVRSIARGTGLSEEEILWFTGAAIFSAAVLGILRTVDLVMEIWPPSSAREL